MGTNDEVGVPGGAMIKNEFHPASGNDQIDEAVAEMKIVPAESAPESLLQHGAVNSEVLATMPRCRRARPNKAADPRSYNCNLHGISPLRLGGDDACRAIKWQFRRRAWHCNGRQSVASVRTDSEMLRCEIDIGRRCSVCDSAGVSL